MSGREKWQTVCALAGSIEQALTDVGVEKEFAAEIAEAIRRKAGSYLPPVNGVFEIKLGDAGVNN